MPKYQPPQDNFSRSLERQLNAFIKHELKLADSITVARDNHRRVYHLGNRDNLWRKTLADDDRFNIRLAQLVERYKRSLREHYAEHPAPAREPPLERQPLPERPYVLYPMPIGRQQQFFFDFEIIREIGGIQWLPVQFGDTTWGQDGDVHDYVPRAGLRELTFAVAKEAERNLQLEREAARARGKELLFSLLTAEQQAEFELRRQISLRSQSGKQYIIDCGNGYAGNIHCVGHTVRAKHWMTLESEAATCICAYPADDRTVPPEDIWAAQFLALRFAEQSLLDVAVRHA